MAVGDPYANVALYRSIISKIDPSTDAEIQDDLKAVSRYLDRRLGRHFNREGTVAAAVSRTYMPKSSGHRRRADWAESENPWLYGGLTRVLDVDDLVSIEANGLDIDENIDNAFSLTLTTSDYELLPRNANLGPEPKPYRQIELTSWGSQYAWTPGARVRITGIWGWPAVPEAIVRATVQLTAILRLESPRARREINDMNQVVGMSSRGASIVDDLVNVYKVVTF